MFSRLSFSGPMLFSLLMRFLPFDLSCQRGGLDGFGDQQVPALGVCRLHFTDLVELRLEQQPSRRADPVERDAPQLPGTAFAEKVPGSFADDLFGDLPKAQVAENAIVVNLEQRIAVDGRFEGFLLLGLLR